ncbi:16S rRNA (guanine(527)-N(7))-methyltransferase RsmG [Nakamurella flava]|uniref:Ribosomal RNA small subunit methyltransferase G n=1 Tax=Nakamurella flava TaxID=2576308 RepID=A0A4U6QAQ9_9ACTN|nr:16S rRNA (guanine(527)-N(7))-methyltransferase RsmG [Nakamurella flava]TKV56982.1 16S rRNA (guanine(527)-N(7))-methyltransferase RsmG [Nakamurella flava]
MTDGSTGVEPEPAVAGDLFGTGLAGARQYVELLATAGVERGLIGPRETDRLWSRHVVNSAAVTEVFPADVRVVDIGTGAGLPGIPLALARPDLRVDLVETLERRVVFLREAVEALGLTGRCRVVHGRAESVIDECGEADVVTSRAVAPLHRLAGWSAPLLRAGGLLLAMKGQSAADEIVRDAAALDRAGLVGAEVVTTGGRWTDPAVTIVRATRSAGGPPRPRSRTRPSRRSTGRG